MPIRVRCVRRACPWLVSIAVVLSLADPSFGQYTWNSTTTGNWNSAGNWTGGVPVSSATTSLTFGSAATQTSTYTATNDIGGAGSGTPFLLNTLTFNNTSGTVTLAGNPLTFSGTAPALTVSGAGSLSLSTPVNLNSADATPNVTFGGTGAGAVSISGALNGGTTNNLIKSMTGNLTLSGGGTLNQISVQAGSTFITGGTLALTQLTDAGNVPAGLQIGSAAGQTAAVTISSGATVNVTDNVYIGDIAGSTGTLTVTGSGTVLNLTGGTSNRLGIGNNGAGTLNILAGGVVNVQRVFTPRLAGSSSTVLIDGTGSTLHVTAQLSIASQGSGNVTVSGGGQIVVDATAATFNMGANPTGTGTLTVTGTGSTVNTAVGLTMGAAVGGTGTFGVVVQSGGTFTAGNSIFMGPNTGITANISVTGASSTLTTTGFLVVGGTGVGGTPGATASVAVGTSGSITATLGMSVFNTGTVNINTGGAMSVGNLADGNATSTGTVNVASGTALTISGASDATFTGLIAGAGGIVKSGASNQTLSGANTFSGGTTVSGGTLTVTTATALGTGPVTVGTGATLNSTVPLTIPNGATLSGAGTAIGNFTIAPGATIRGGASGTTGTLTVTGNLIAQAAVGSAERTQLTISPTGGSTVNVSGTVNFTTVAGSAPFVIDIQNAGAAPNQQYTRTVVTATGGFQLNGLGPLPVGTAFTQGTDFVLTSSDFASFTGTTSLVVGAGNTLVLTFTPVPEPATVLGLAAAAGLLVRFRRRFV